MSNSGADYADSPAFGSNKVAAAGGADGDDEEAIAHAADYREPRQMTRMEESQSPMELLLQKTKLRSAQGLLRVISSTIYLNSFILLAFSGRRLTEHRKKAS